MAPPAPGRISMITGCPSRRDTSSSTTRLTVSDALPAGYGLITLIGLVGHCCAFANVAEAISITAKMALIARKQRTPSFVRSVVMVESREGRNEFSGQGLSLLIETRHRKQTWRNA